MNPDGRPLAARLDQRRVEQDAEDLADRVRDALIGHGWDYATVEVISEPGRPVAVALQFRGECWFLEVQR
jgi:hypothetical protein